MLQKKKEGDMNVVETAVFGSDIWTYGRKGNNPRKNMQRERTEPR